MRKVILYIAMSLDGYIATSEGSVAFLDDFQNSADGDYGYEDFVQTIDTCIMGHHTYKAILDFGYPWPYMQQQTYVVTSNSNAKLDSPQTALLTQEVGVKIQQLKEEPTGKDIWVVGGGQLVHYMLNQALLDQLIVTVTPKILGDGIRLFPPQLAPSTWQLKAQKTFESGLVMLTYEK